MVSSIFLCFLLLMVAAVVIAVVIFSIKKNRYGLILPIMAIMIFIGYSLFLHSSFEF